MRKQHSLWLIILLSMAAGPVMSAFGQTNKGQANQPQKNVVEDGHFIVT